VSLLSVTASAQEESVQIEDPAHDEIRALRDDAIKAYEEKDIEQLLSYLHPDVVVTVQNAETLRGHDEVRAFHKRMSVGDSSEVVSTQSRFEVDQLATLYGGDTAVATGSMNDQFELRRGMTFSLQSRWTATLVKGGDQWLVSAFHVSTNMFDNGVSRLLLWWRSVWVGLIATCVGFIAGVFVATRFRRRATVPSDET
jgi:uncharacterized protein (TIGR02246 family)